MAPNNYEDEDYGTLNMPRRPVVPPRAGGSEPASPPPAAPRPPKPKRPAPPPAPAAPPAPPVAAAPPPPPPVQSQPAWAPPPAPQAPPQYAHAQEPQGPGGMRKFFIKMLGGAVPAEGAAPGAYPSQPPAYPAPEPHPHYAAMPPQQPPAGPASPPKQVPATLPPHLPAESGDHTVGLGVRVKQIQASDAPYRLQILDIETDQWIDRGPIERTGYAIHSGSTHLAKLAYDQDRLMVGALDTVNGVYVKLGQPMPIRDGDRFRIGKQVIDFRLPTAPDAITPYKALSGEKFVSGDPVALAFLEFVRPDMSVGLRFPMTKPLIILGRNPQKVDIALSQDPQISGEHCRVFSTEGRFFLEDLKSRNGTFTLISGESEVGPGDQFLVGPAVFRVIHAG
jgi:hypothetical protein